MKLDWPILTPNVVKFQMNSSVDLVIQTLELVESNPFVLPFAIHGIPLVKKNTTWLG